MARGMRAAEAAVPYGGDVYGDRDQVVYLSNVSWEDYERIELVVRCMHERTQTAAVQALRAALAKKRGQRRAGASSAA